MQTSSLVLCESYLRLHAVNLAIKLQVSLITHAHKGTCSASASFKSAKEIEQVPLFNC